MQQRSKANLAERLKEGCRPHKKSHESNPMQDFESKDTTFATSPSNVSPNDVNTFAAPCSQFGLTTPKEKPLKCFLPSKVNYGLSTECRAIGDCSLFKDELFCTPGGGEYGVNELKDILENNEDMQHTMAVACREVFSTDSNDVQLMSPGVYSNPSSAESVAPTQMIGQTSAEPRTATYDTFYLESTPLDDETKDVTPEDLYYYPSLVTSPTVESNIATSSNPETMVTNVFRKPTTLFADAESHAAEIRENDTPRRRSTSQRINIDEQEKDQLLMNFTPNTCLVPHETSYMEANKYSLFEMRDEPEADEAKCVLPEHFHQERYAQEAEAEAGDCSSPQLSWEVCRSSIHLECITPGILKNRNVEGSATGPSEKDQLPMGVTPITRFVSEGAGEASVECGELLLKGETSSNSANSLPQKLKAQKQEASRSTDSSQNVVRSIPCRKPQNGDHESKPFERNEKICDSSKEKKSESRPRIWLDAYCICVRKCNKYVNKWFGFDRDLKRTIGMNVAQLCWKDCEKRGIFARAATQERRC